MSEWLIYPIFFLVALLYSSVGLGGGTGYLAILALFGITAPYIAPAVLFLNLFVAGLSFHSFYRAGHFNKQYFIPFIISSIPAAFIGGRIPIGEDFFSLMLGLVLTIAGIKTLLFPRVQIKARSKLRGTAHWLSSLGVGGLIGLLGGITGCGGGFLLIPTIIFIFKLPTKTAAASGAGFVFLNSLSALSGHLLRGNFNFGFSFPFVIFVLAGGLLGANLGASKLSHTKVERILGLVLLAGAIRLLI